MNNKILSVLYDFRKNRTLLLMLMPATIFFFIFAYIPMIGIIIAFKSFSFTGGIFKSPWVGFENYRFLFVGGKIFKVALNTIAYNSVFIVLGTLFSISIAIFLSEIKGKAFKKATQSMMFIPYFVSWVVVGAFIYNIFNFEYGTLNSILKVLGVESVDVSTNIGIWKYIIVAAQSWKWVGYGSVIYLAAIMGIDEEIYDASKIDGASRTHKIKYITIPSLTPTIITLTLLNIGNIFRGDFQMFYQVTGNNPLLYDSTDVIDTFVMRTLNQLHEFGMASAAGTLQSVMCFTILVTVNYVVKRNNKEYALF